MCLPRDRSWEGAIVPLSLTGGSLGDVAALEYCEERQQNERHHSTEYSGDVAQPDNVGDLDAVTNSTRRAGAFLGVKLVAGRDQRATLFDASHHPAPCQSWASPTSLAMR